MKAYATAAAVSRTERDRLIADHVEVARRIALRVARRVPDWISTDDLIGAAMVGLAEAADRYDPTRQEPFVAFAERRIRGAVLDELRRGDIMPRRVRMRAREIGDAVARLEQQLGRAPEDEEVAAELGVDLAVYQEDLKVLNHVSLVEMDLGGEDVRFAQADGASPAAEAERRELLRRVREALPNLQPRDAQLLSLYYVEGMTYAEIAEVFGVSESRVCQLHSRAMARLRAEIDRPKLRAIRGGKA